MSTEFVERFSYRKYTGSYQSRWRRIWSLARFEIGSTWHKSTLGKIILILLIIINVIIALISFQISGLIPSDPSIDRQAEISNSLAGIVGSYFPRHIYARRRRAPRR